MGTKDGPESEDSAVLLAFQWDLMRPTANVRLCCPNLIKTVKAAAAATVRVTTLMITTVSFVSLMGSGIMEAQPQARP